MKKLIAVLVLLFLASSYAQAGEVKSDLLYYLKDHPGASLTADGISYGLRLDSLMGSDAENTFSTDSELGMTLFWEGASGTALMLGDVRNNASGEDWATWYGMEHANPISTVNGDGFAANYGIGVMTNFTQTYVIESKFKSGDDMLGVGDAFFGLGDGFRCEGVECHRESMQEVGRGWLRVTEATDSFWAEEFFEIILSFGHESVDLVNDKLAEALGICLEQQACTDITNGTNDWLVQMKPVPVPAALPLLASGLLGFSVFSRRKAS